MSLRAFLLPTICLAAYLSSGGLANAQTFKPISPLDIPGNTIAQQLGKQGTAQAKRVFQTLETQTEQTVHAQSNTGPSTYELIENYSLPISAHPRVAGDLVTIPYSCIRPPNQPKHCMTVDLAALYIFVNRVQKALVSAGKGQSLTGPNHVKVVRLNDYAQFNTAKIQRMAAPQVAPAVTLSSTLSAAPMLRADAENGQPCPNAEPPISKDALQDAWSQIGQMQSNSSTLKRCDLAFRDELAQAEAAAPIVTIPASIPIAFSGFNDGGDNHWMQASLSNSLDYVASGHDVALEYNGSLKGQFLYWPYDLAELCASIETPQTGDPKTVLSAKIGSKPVYQMTGSWKNYVQSWPETNSFPIVAPVDEDFSAFGVPIHAELNVTGNYQLNAKIQTQGTAAYLSISPALSADVTGSLQSNFIIVTTGVDGKLNLIDAKGDFGSIVAVFPDITDPTTNANGRKSILLVGLADDYSATAFKAGVTLYAKTLFNITLFSYDVSFNNGNALNLITPVAGEGRWFAYYLAPSVMASSTQVTGPVAAGCPTT